MDKPIIDPSILTTEQKSVIKTFYETSREDLFANNELSKLVGSARLNLLEILFGKI